MGCGICAVACPVNKEIDAQMAYGGHAATDELLLRIDSKESHGFSTWKSAPVARPARSIARMMPSM